VPRRTHAAKSDLRFGDLACELLDFRIGVRACQASGECFNLLRKYGAECMGTLNAWRSALVADLARPCAVFGPVLARAFARLALILDALVIVVT
jgi:hypothetical protein